jgi:hypothetical protein
MAPGVPVLSPPIMTLQTSQNATFYWRLQRRYRIRIGTCRPLHPQPILSAQSRTLFDRLTIRRSRRVQVQWNERMESHLHGGDAFDRLVDDPNVETAK